LEGGWDHRAAPSGRVRRTVRVTCSRAKRKSRGRRGHVHGRIPGIGGSMIESEIVIVGGGIAGCSTAFHLASHGRGVVLLERGTIASAATGQKMGGIDSYRRGDGPDLQPRHAGGRVRTRGREIREI